jgi:hypothetical protein
MGRNQIKTGAGAMTNKKTAVTDYKCPKCYKTENGIMFSVLVFAGREVRRCDKCGASYSYPNGGAK